MSLVKVITQQLRLTLLAFVLPVLVLLQSNAWAETSPLSAEVSAPIEAWKLERLPSDWWRAFEQADQTLLTVKLQALQARLMSEIALQPAELQNDLANQMDAIRLNSRAYVDLRQKEPTLGKQELKSVSSYTLVQWLDLLQAVRLAKQAQQKEQYALDQLSAQLDAIAGEADDAAAAYVSESQQGKLSRLVVMIERRFAWLVVGQSLRLQRLSLDKESQRLEKLIERWQAATQQLSLAEADVKQVSSDLSKTRTELEKQFDRLRSAQASAALVWGDDALSRVKAHRQQVNALSANIELLMARLYMQWNERLLAYVNARLDTAFDWEKSLRMPLETWQSDWQAFESLRTQLKNQLEHRREQVQTDFLALSEHEPSEVNPRQLSQVKHDYQEVLQQLSNEQTLLKSADGLLKDLSTLDELQVALLLAHDGVWRNRWHSTLQLMRDVTNQSVELLTTTLFKVGDTPVTSMGLLRVVMFIMIAWWVSFWLRKGLTTVAARNEKIARHTTYTLGRLIHYIIMVIGIVVALSSVGIDFSSLAWIAGALSVGIGFGLQDVVKNFVAGLIVMFEKTLKVGDYIELPSGISGTVKEISLRSTLIITGDNLEVVVPNAEFTSGRVVNWTLSDLYRRVHIPFNVSLASDKKEVVDAVLQAAKQVPYSIQEGRRQPQVVLSGLEGKMSFELLVWIKQGTVNHAYGVKASYLWQIESALRQRGIELV